VIASKRKHFTRISTSYFFFGLRGARDLCPLEKETCHNSILLIGSNISEILLVSKQGGISIERGQPQYLFPSKLNS